MVKQAEDWKSKALRYGLLGGGIGAAGSLVLNALHSIANRRRPVEQLVPRTIIDQPYYVDEEQARRLKERGIQVRMPEFGKTASLRRSLYKTGKCFSDIVESKTHLKLAQGGIGQWLGEGVTDFAVPALAGLGGGYLGFRGVDWLFDKMHRQSAQEKYEAKRKELRRLMQQMDAGLGKVASDRLHGGNLDDQMVYFVNNVDEIMKVAGAIMQSNGITKKALFEGLGDKVLGSTKPLWKGYGGLLGGAGILAAIAAFPSALRAFKQRNPNTQTVREIEEYYRKLPDQPRVRMVPTLRRPPRRGDEEEEEEGALPGPGYKRAAATNPSLAGEPVHSSIHPPEVDTSPDEPRGELSMRPGVPMSLGEPATGGPASSTAMPSPNSQTSTSPSLGSPLPNPAGPPKPFSGMFANTGFTRRNAGNMPTPKNPQARTPRMTANIGNAVA